MVPVLPYEFFKSVEGRQKYVIYGDTDSMYLNIPVKPRDIEDALTQSKVISEEINAVIAHFNVNYLLPKMGISPEYNFTDFKTELIADFLLLLDSKKNYSYRILAKENEVLPKPKVKYTGMSVVKSDVPILTKMFIKGLVEDIVFNPQLTREQMVPEVNKLAATIQRAINEDIATCRFDRIGTPKKWGTGYKNDVDPSQVIAMRLYNTILNEPILTPLAGALTVPIMIESAIAFENKLAPIRNNHKYFVGSTPTSNFSKLGIPYSYDAEKLKHAMEYFGIKIDPAETWKVTYNATAVDIVQLIKKHCSGMQP